VNSSSNKSLLRHAGELALCLAAVAAVVSACATVVEEPLEATSDGPTGDNGRLTATDADTSRSGPPPFRARKSS